MDMFKPMNYEKIEEKLVRFIKEKTKEKPVLIGLSGGIDSSVTCALALKALGPDKVKALIIANSRYSTKELDIARNFAKKHRIETREIDSTKIKNDLLVETKIDLTDVQHVSSLDARICDLLIRTVACEEDRIYLGTINGTERITGWYPKGALVGDFCPIGGLLKTQIKHLALYMGLADLVETISEDASKVCSGCGELAEFKGIDYSTLDRVLYLYENTLVDEFHARISEYKIPNWIVTTILQRIAKVAHKSDVFPEYCVLSNVR